MVLLIMAIAATLAAPAFARFGTEQPPRRRRRDDRPAARRAESVDRVQRDGRRCVSIQKRSSTKSTRRASAASATLAAGHARPRLWRRSSGRTSRACSTCFEPTGAAFADTVVVRGGDDPADRARGPVERSGACRFSLSARTRGHLAPRSGRGDRDRRDDVGERARGRRAARCARPSARVARSRSRRSRPRGSSSWTCSPIAELQALPDSVAKGKFPTPLDEYSWKTTSASDVRPGWRVRHPRHRSSGRTGRTSCGRITTSRRRLVTRHDDARAARDDAHGARDRFGDHRA